MNKKGLILVFSIVVVVIAVFIFWSLSQQNDTLKPAVDDAIVYYYGSQCPHCKKVAEFISANAIEEKLSIIKKEVTEVANKKNANEWIARAKECDLKESEIGVPFLYAKGKCYMGDVEAINFLKKEAGIQ